MSQKLALSFLLLALTSFAGVDESFSKKSLSEEPRDPSIASYFNDTVRKFRCDFAQKMIQELDRTNDKDMMKKIELETRHLEKSFALNKKNLNRPERKLFKAQLKALRKLKRKRNLKSSTRKFYQNLCEKTEDITWKSFRALAHGANGVLLGATFPLRFIWEFGKGLVQGTRICLVKENQKWVEKPCAKGRKHTNLYDQIGRGFHRSLATIALWQSIDGFFKAVNLNLLPLATLPMIDHKATQLCSRVNSSNEKEVKFCQNYQEVKNTFFKGIVYGNKLGRKMNKKKVLMPHKSQMPKLDPFTSENICSNYQILKKYESPYNKGKGRRELVQAVLNPGYFSIPKRFDVDVPENQYKKVDFYERVKLKNIIITLGPSKFHQDRLNRLDQKELDQMITEFKALEKSRKKMYRAKSKERCEKIQKKRNFSWERLVELREKITEDKQNEFKAQDKVALKLIKQAKGKWRFSNKLKLDWEVVNVNTLKSIFETLKRRDVGNVFIVVHSSDSFKKLVDSDLNLIPSTTFSQISPTIMSLTFYSCHSLNLMETYKLKKKFSRNQSIHKLKHLFFVNENEYLGNTSYAPLTGLKSYLIKVDNYLYNSIRGNNLFAGIHQYRFEELRPEKMCELDLGSNLKVKKGTMSIDLNRELIGSFTFYDPLKTISFPCRMLNKEVNKISLGGVINGKSQKLEINDEKNIQMSFVTPGENLARGKEKIRYSRRTGLFSGYLLELLKSY